MKKFTRILSLICCCLILSVTVFNTGVFAKSKPDMPKAKTEKEHIVLVHGGWHGAWCWYRVKSLLEKENYDVTVLDLPGHGYNEPDISATATTGAAATITNEHDNSGSDLIPFRDYVQKGKGIGVGHLPGHGYDKSHPSVTVTADNGDDISNPSSITFQDYVEKVTDVLNSIDGKVILVGHGTSGGVVSAVAEENPDKIKKLVYLAGVLVTNGQSIGDVLLNNTESLGVENSVIDMNTGTVSIKDEVINEAIYGLSPKKDIKLARKLMRPEPLVPLLTPITLTDENFGKVPRYYIRTLHDKCLTPEYQKELLKTTNCKKVYDLDSDHAAYFSNPKGLVKLLIKISEDN